MYMPGGSCTTPVSADCHSCTCSYCSTTATDCSVCGADTYYEGYSTNTACDTCESGKTITDDGTDASLHDEAEDCVWYPTPVGVLGSACGGCWVVRVVGGWLVVDFV